MVNGDKKVAELWISRKKILLFVDDIPVAEVEAALDKLMVVDKGGVVVTVLPQ